jgi:hypothetical protein
VPVNIVTSRATHRPTPASRHARAVSPAMPARILRAPAVAVIAAVVVAVVVAVLPAGMAAAQGDTSTPASTALATTTPTTTTLLPTTIAAASSTATTLAATTTAGPLIPTTAPLTTAGATTSVAPNPLGGSATATVLPSIPPTSTTVVRTRVLKQGMRGADVEAMERKLDLLRYDVGSVDQKFDWQTWQGLIAFQKLNGLPRTAKFDLRTQAALAAATVPGGMIPNGGLPRIEVDISRQVLLYFDSYGLNRVVAVSTGSGRNYCDFSKKSQKQVCGSAVTPRGNYKIQRRIKGDRESDLGHLYNPMYFNGGFAIHGSPSIPAGPASHGCVRVSNYTANWMFDTVSNGTPVYVFD